MKPHNITSTEITSAERVNAALSHRECDRVAFFLLLTTHGARELGLSIRDYFARAELVAEAQLRMQARYGHDCLLAFFYAALELEAWGGKTIFFDDGPPNTAGPVLSLEDIRKLVAPRVADARCLHRVLETISILKRRSSGIPIIGVVVSPFSLPVMQLGFAKYLDAFYERPDVIEHLLQINEEFCVEWGNAQLRAGAHMLVYFDPCCSPTMISPQITQRYGFSLARQVISRLEGPVATSLASGRCLSVIEDLRATATKAIGVGPLDDLRELKRVCGNDLSIVGNLNGIEMCCWDSQRAENVVKQTIAIAAPGGGFILSDSHGEIPYQVSEATLAAIAGTVAHWGSYPLTWI